MKPVFYLLTDNFFLKICSLILGILLWSFLADSYMTYKWIDVPLCFYNKTEKIDIQAPNTIKIKLMGIKSALRNLEKENIAIHIDTNKLNSKTPYIISNKDLFLAPGIKLIDYLPHTINIKTTIV